jgi:hypothetical protein
MSRGMSFRAYARHREALGLSGASDMAVRKALKAGRITAGADGLIDPEVADRQWAGSTDVSHRPQGLRLVPGEGAPRVPSASPGPPETPASASLEDAPRLASSYAASRAAREAYLARLAKLDFEQRSGKLVDADEVRAQVFGLGRRLRDAFLGMPDRLSPVLAGQSDQALVHRLLTEEIMVCLAELAVAPSLRPGAKGEGRK